MKDEKQKKTIESAALDDEQLDQVAGGDFGYNYPQPGVEPPPPARGNDDNPPPELPPPGPNFF